MRLVAKKTTIALVILSAFSMAHCVSSSGGGDEPDNDTASAVDVVAVDDATGSQDVVSVEDTVSAEDGSSVADTASVEDTAPAVDVPSVADVTPVEDTATEDDVATTEDVATPEDTAPPQADGLCTSPDDLAIVDSQDENFDIEKISKDCVLANIFGDPDGEKAKQCIQDATDLSDGCTECFGEVALCGKDKCIGSCALDPDGDACSDCVAANCLPAFEECSGLSTEKPE